MGKQFIIKGKVVEMEFDEVLKEFTPSIHKEINRQKAVFNRESEEREDMYQEASIWLYRAYEKYDIEKGYHFSTFARLYIKRGVQEITEINRKQKRTGETVSMDQSISGDGDFTLGDVLSEVIDFDSPLVARDVLAEAIKNMTDTEIEYLELMLQDYTKAEAGRERGVSRVAAGLKYKIINEKIEMVAVRHGY